MNRTLRHHLAAATVTAALAAGLLATAPAAQAAGVDLSNPAAVTAAADYSCGPVKSTDQAVVDALNPTLTGTLHNWMTPYRLSCARAIVNTVQSRGLPERAAVIAVTTSIVETTLRNNPNTEDHDSVGLFQQRASWGSFENRMNPTWATTAFLNSMLRVSNWQTRPIGEVCQAVQISAFPAKYQPQAADGERIVRALLGSASGAGDQPVAGNWDGGPAGNVGVFRPSTGQFHLRNDDGSLVKLDWGQAGDLPVSANFDGSGPDNIGIFRPSTGQFHLRNDDGSLVKLDWGQAGDLPIAGNWDGGPAGNVGIFRPSTGQFHLRNDDGSLVKLDWGQAGDLPISGNFDGSGPDNIGVFRPSTGQFHLRNDDGSLVKLDWGQAGDLPVAANFDGGNGAPATNVGIWRPSTAQFHLRNDDGSLVKLDWGQPR
ncbi:hypothetical protein [Kitasatospora sp. NBC_00458]|uniref:hypothetical protein n=1 Tax=Kitasatospora sp. NBC_00458 TaxID=2903568 RepID=UPI002E18794E